MKIPRNRIRGQSFFVAILLSPLLVACSSSGPYRLDLMPAPDLYSVLKLNPFSGKQFDQLVPYGGMLYATDRAPAIESDSPYSFYQNRRGHVLRLGVGTIEFAKGKYTWQQTKEISLRPDRRPDDFLHVSGVKEFGVLESSRSKLFATKRTRELRSANRSVADAVNEKLSRSRVKDVYIYVHGYKLVFADPLLVATELWHYLGYQGVFIAYSWPATPNGLAYARDLETTAYSARNLRLLIEYLARSTRAHRIHIIAHSAGTRVAIDALAQLAFMNSGQRDIGRYRVGRVILIGSDIDRGVFSGYLEDGLLNVPESMTVYLSGSDRALGFATFLFTRRRVGQLFQVDELPRESIEYLRRTPKLKLIDVTAAKKANAKRGHDYFRRSPWVSSDMLVTLKYGLKPGERGLVRDDKLPIWTFPRDYIERLKKILPIRKSTSLPKNESLVAGDVGL